MGTDSKDRFKIAMPNGPKLRVTGRFLTPGTTPLIQADKRSLRRGFLAGWLRLGLEVAKNINANDVVDFNRWTLNEFGIRINHREETTDKEFFKRLRELQADFLDGRPKGDEDDEDEDDGDEEEEE